MGVTIVICTPVIDRPKYFNNSKPYTATVSSQVTPTNPQGIFLFTAYMATNCKSYGILCFLNFELYFKNGTLCTIYNSQVIVNEGVVGLYLTNSKAFDGYYYFRATSYSQNKNQSSSVNSSIFQVIVTSDLQSSGSTPVKSNVINTTRTITNNGQTLT